MSQTEKAAYYKALKAAGVNFEHHYREYSTEDLKQAYEKLTDEKLEMPAENVTPNDGYGDEPPPDPSFFGFPEPEPEPVPVDQPAQAPLVPMAEKDPDEMAGQRLNSQGDEPIRTDEQGRVWYQEEIQKPAYPKPRGRRVLTYMDTGVQTKQVKVGDYVETFEVAGEGPGRVAEVRITLPSYQVGIYKDPRFPFRVHTYNGVEGFDFFEVCDYYHGSELVPAECKRIYVENVLCFDIRSVIRAINNEYRALQLQGKVD